MLSYATKVGLAGRVCRLKSMTSCRDCVCMILYCSRNDDAAVHGCWYLDMPIVAKLVAQASQPVGHNGITPHVLEMCKGCALFMIACRVDEAV